MIQTSVQNPAAVGLRSMISLSSPCLQMVSRPQQFEVMVMPNLYGNILGNIGTGIVGGPGMTAGANIGNRCAIFEQVHILQILNCLGEFSARVDEMCIRLIMMVIIMMVIIMMVIIIMVIIIMVIIMMVIIMMVIIMMVIIRNNDCDIPAYLRDVYTTNAVVLFTSVSVSIVMLMLSKLQGTRNSGRSLVGKNVANPSAMLLAGADMLSHLGCVPSLIGHSIVIPWDFPHPNMSHSQYFRLKHHMRMLNDAVYEVIANPEVCSALIYTQTNPWS